MITNPNLATFDRAIVRDAEEDDDKGAITSSVQMKVKRHTYADPDALYDTMVGSATERIVEVDAKIMERVRGGKWEQRHYRSLRELMASPAVRRRVLNTVSAHQMKDVTTQIRESVRKDPQISRAVSRLKEDDAYSSGFALGLYPDEISTMGSQYATVFPLQDTILPGTSGPASKQQLYFDYMDMHRKGWEAATRNPLGVRIVNIIPQFVLGRGVVGTIKNAAHQKAWDEFYKLNKMRWRVRQVLKELLIYGEVFNRYFKRPEGLIVRQVDPSTIWDVVTDPEDIEKVHFYHQQYSILNVSPVPQAAKYNPSRLVIRQIPADQIDHFRINTTTSEKRGRSQLYSILAHLLRFKEFVNDRVLLNKMRAMFALDVSVKGAAADVAAVQEQFNRPIGAGAVLVHNDAAEVEFKNANNNANEAKTDAEMILKVIAVGAGVSEQFLGVSGASTRAGALIQTEPDVKNFETYQEMVEDMLMAVYERVKVAKKLGDARALMEFTFPALAQEDRSAKLKDVAYCEAMSYISKSRAAAMAAKELNISAYDFDQEQAEIKKEIAQEPWVAAEMQQVPKHAPDPMAMAEMPGLGADMQPGAPEPGQPGKLGRPVKAKSGVDVPNRVTQTSGQMGFSAKRLSGRGLPNTQATLDRSTFTRGTEKTSIRNQRSAGAPLRASAHGPRNVWNGEARMRSILKRKEQAIDRLKEKVASATGEVLVKLTEKLVEKQAELKALREKQ